MSCPKCKSCVLVEETATDPENGRAVCMIRCPICGYYTDSTMRANKARPVTDPKDMNPQAQSPRCDFE